MFYIIENQSWPQKAFVFMNYTYCYLEIKTENISTLSININNHFYVFLPNQLFGYYKKENGFIVTLSIHIYFSCLFVWDGLTM